MALSPDQVMASLDVGSSKVVCLIAEKSPEGLLAVKGFGLCANEGMIGGEVRDLQQVERAIRTAVAKAENMAGTHISGAYVSFSGGKPVSQIIEVETALDGKAVTQADIDRLVADARAMINLPEARLPLHSMAVAYALDGRYDAKAQLGLFGQKFGLSLHVISVDAGPLRNLEMAVRDAQLEIEDVVLSTYASALAVMIDDEKAMGAACIDMGAGKNGIVLFGAGALVHTAQLNEGGQKVNELIMRQMLTSREGAEALKIRSGAAIALASDERQQIDIQRLGDRESEGLEGRAVLTSLMQAEYERELQNLATALEASGFTGAMGRRVILTGGASLVPRLRELAEKILARDVRIGEPRAVIGLPENARTAAYATAVGLLYHGLQMSMHRQNKQRSGRKASGPVRRLFRWLGDTF